MEQTPLAISQQSPITVLCNVFSECVGDKMVRESIKYYNYFFLQASFLPFKPNIDGIEFTEQPFELLLAGKAPARLLLPCSLVYLATLQPARLLRSA